MFETTALRSAAVICLVCGQPLLGDPEDQPDPPLGPLCGECYRGQQMDDELDWAADLGSGAGDDSDF
jgi:hypothetical protein